MKVKEIILPAHPGALGSNRCHWVRIPGTKKEVMIGAYAPYPVRLLVRKVRDDA